MHNILKGHNHLTFLTHVTGLAHLTLSCLHCFTHLTHIFIFCLIISIILLNSLISLFTHISLVSLILLISLISLNPLILIGFGPSLLPAFTQNRANPLVDAPMYTNTTYILHHVYGYYRRFCRLHKLDKLYKINTLDK
jgi:hypothetical protein